LIGYAEYVSSGYKSGALWLMLVIIQKFYQFFI